MGPERDRWSFPFSNSSNSFQKSLTALSTASSRSVFRKFRYVSGFTKRAIRVLGSIVLKLSMLLFMWLYFLLYDFYPIFEFIIWPFKTPDKGETNEFNHLKFYKIYHPLRLLLVKRSKSHQKYLNALKWWDLNFLFFPYAIRGSMHEVGEFYNQPPSNLHTSLRGRTRGYKRGWNSFQSVLNFRIPSSRRLT